MKVGARRLWKLIVASHAADHFQAGDLPLLQAYCEAGALHREAAQEIKREGAVIKFTRTETRPDGAVVVEITKVKANPWVAIMTQAAHTMAQLATKLRLCLNAKKGPWGGQEDKPRRPSLRAGLLFGEGD
jgi:P27 family predicted phage terminase small subunit